MTKSCNSQIHFDANQYKWNVFQVLNGKVFVAEIESTQLQIAGVCRIVHSSHGIHIIEANLKRGDDHYLVSSKRYRSQVAGATLNTGFSR